MIESGRRTLALEGAAVLAAAERLDDDFDRAVELLAGAGRVVVTGIGKSGVYQRWVSVVLVPFSGGKPAGTAHRFVGYWAGCDSLQAAATQGQVLLPVIERSEPKGAKPVRLVDYQCSATGCEGKVDERIVDGDPVGESGGMSIRGK